MDTKQQTTLNRAVTMILKPLLRVLIKNEVSYSEFAEIAKQSYVDVSYEHFSIEKRKTTFSRVAVLTGLSRKEVVRLSKLRADDSNDSLLSKATPNRAQRVINGWVSDTEFHDDKGQARVLPIYGDKGSFAALVARYSGDITAGAVIDELLRIGVVQRLDDQRVELLSDGYIPKTDEIEKIRVMAMCTSDLLNSAVHNLINLDKPSRYQRQLTYEKISTDDANQFKTYSEEKANELLLHLNEYLSQMSSDAPDDISGSHQVGLGIYYFENDESNKEG